MSRGRLLEPPQCCKTELSVKDIHECNKNDIQINKLKCYLDHTIPKKIYFIFTWKTPNCSIESEDRALQLWLASDAKVL